MASGTVPGAAGISYTYTFTTATTSALDSVTDDGARRDRRDAGGRYRDPVAAGGRGERVAGRGSLTYTFTPAAISAGTVVSIEITGLVNTSATGSYTSVITTSDAGSPVDSGTTPAVSFPGSLTLTSPDSLSWAATDTGLDQNAVDTVPARSAAHGGRQCGNRSRLAHHGLGDHVHQRDACPAGHRGHQRYRQRHVADERRSERGLHRVVHLPGQYDRLSRVHRHGGQFPAGLPPSMTPPRVPAPARSPWVAAGRRTPLDGGFRVPATAYVGSYTSTLTLTVESGP